MGEIPNDRSVAEGGSGRNASGFTLIEILAVAALIVLIVGIGIPQLGRNSYDLLSEEGENLAQSLRFARQRAIMTGVPHRVILDLEQGAYRVEWFVSEERAFSAGGGEGGDGPGDLTSLLAGATGGLGPTGEAERLPLSPPSRSEALDYHPVPHRQMGTFRWLDDTLYFVGVDGPTGWVESGDYALVFFEDGTTEPARVELADGDDRHVTLALEALLDRVDLREGEARS